MWMASQARKTRQTAPRDQEPQVSLKKLVLSIAYPATVQASVVAFALHIATIGRRRRAITKRAASVSPIDAGPPDEYTIAFSRPSMRSSASPAAERSHRLAELARPQYDAEASCRRRARRLSKGDGSEFVMPMLHSTTD